MNKDLQEKSPHRRIRVLYLVQSYNMGGAENLAFLLCKSLKATHIEPIFCALEDTGPLKRSLAEAGVRHLSLNKRHGVDATVPARLWQLIRRENVEIIHVHNLGPLLYGYPARVLSPKVKFVYTEHVRLCQEIGVSNKLMSVARFMFRSVDVFLNIAAHISEYFESEFSIDRNRIRTIPNGVDTARFHQHDDLRPYASQSPVIGNIAAMREQKDQLTLIEAMALIVKAIPGARLLMVGSGPLEGKLRERVSELQLNENVTFLGHRTDIPELLNSFDLFVLPSLFEGLPLCLLESMACGTPIVATDAYGNRELVRHGETGLLVPTRNPAALADAVISLLDDPGRLACFAAAGRKLVERDYTLDAALTAYCDFYLGLSAAR